MYIQLFLCAVFIVLGFVVGGLLLLYLFKMSEDFENMINIHQWEKREKSKRKEKKQQKKANKKEEKRINKKKSYNDCNIQSHTSFMEETSMYKDGSLEDQILSARKKQDAAYSYANLYTNTKKYRRDSQ